MPIRIALAALALVIAGTSGLAHANGREYDHLKCFKIRDSLVDRRTIYLADIFPDLPFGDRSDCRLRLPALHFCVNVAKENVQVGGEPFATLDVPGETGRDYLCYDLKCDRDRLEVDALDQFGARPLRVRKSDFLCMPANKIGPVSSPSPTHTPTPEPTPPPNPCRLIIDATDGQSLIEDVCGGDCPPDETCASTGITARGPASCACVPDADLCGERPLSTGNQLPMCGGFCPGPLEVCVEETPGAQDGGRPALTCQCVLR